MVINNYNNNNSAAATDAGYIVTSSATNYAPQWSSDVSPSLPPRPTRQPAPSPSSEGDDDDDDDDDCPDPSQFQEESIVGKNQLSFHLILLFSAIFLHLRPM